MAAKKKTTTTRKKTAPTKAVAPKKTAAKKAVAKKTPARKPVARKSAPVEVFDAEAEAHAAGKSLVIVESPAKAKTIGKYLGSAFAVKATVGHVRDLPERTLGIDVENDFEPEYVTTPGKEKTLSELKSAAKNARTVYIATDPDREGEAIAWHVRGQVARKNGPPVRRVLFHEITKEAVTRAIEAAGEIDQKKVDAQQARRVLDRLVGYKASPLLWKTVKKGLSAGRVQTVALRMLVEREREIRAFRPTEYWTIAAALEHEGQAFTAKLHWVDGKKPEIHDEAAAQAILGDLAGRKTFDVTDIKRRERRKNPAAPFTTSTLQQEGAKKLGFGSKRTMRLAQNLYEGIELGKVEGQVGLITFMRTDSQRIAESAVTQARDYLRSQFSEEFLAKTPMFYGAAGDSNAQDAHEGIRPTDPERTPDAVQKFLTPEQFKLYQLIWQRFMASQMAPA